MNNDEINSENLVTDVNPKKLFKGKYFILNKIKIDKFKAGLN